MVGQMFIDHAVAGQKILQRVDRLIGNLLGFARVALTAYLLGTLSYTLEDIGILLNPGWDANNTPPSILAEKGYNLFSRVGASQGRAASLAPPAAGWLRRTHSLARLYSILREKRPEVPEVPARFLAGPVIADAQAVGPRAVGRRVLSVEPAVPPQRNARRRCSSPQSLRPCAP